METKRCFASEHAHAHRLDNTGVTLIVSLAFALFIMYSFSSLSFITRALQCLPSSALDLQNAEKAKSARLG